jgi:hypothetical protein
VAEGSKKGKKGWQLGIEGCQRVIERWGKEGWQRDKKGWQREKEGLPEYQQMIVGEGRGESS